MSDINFSIEYKGSKDDAVAQIKNLEQAAHEKYTQYEGCWEITWKDYGGLVDARIMGMDITGQFDVVERDANSGDVKVSVKLPMLLSMMKDPIEKQLKTEIQKMLG
ncbi:MAG: polyhydroxyalkanoic acid system family protein [Thermoguttaceae bacterium]|nr:polyhydroxyalkanoic acid system family protein [Thermoguttaceae bacterium]